MKPPLNIYSVCPEHNWYGDDYAYEWHVVAPTRGKARAEFIGYMDGFEAEYEWTDKMQIKLLEKNVDLPVGVDENFVWAHRHPEQYPPEFFAEPEGW